MKIFKDFVPLWPGYVHWARGNLKVATENFVVAVELLQNRMCQIGNLSCTTCCLISFFSACDQAVALNEMARMFVHYGERSNAVEFYRKSSNIKIPLGTLGCNYHPQIVILLSSLHSLLIIFFFY